MKVRYIVTLIGFLVGINGFSQKEMMLSPNGFVEKAEKTDYIVLDYENISKSELYKKALVYLKSMYNRPDIVISTVENESIVLNAKTHPIMGDTDLQNYVMEYNIDIRFRDGALKFTPFIKTIEYTFLDNDPAPFYVSNTNSPRDNEVNCLWMYSPKNNDYFLLNEDLNAKFENWVNLYISNLNNAIVDREDW